PMPAKPCIPLLYTLTGLHKCIHDDMHPSGEPAGRLRTRSRQAHFFASDPRIPRMISLPTWLPAALAALPAILVSMSVPAFRGADAGARVLFWEVSRSSFLDWDTAEASALEASISYAEALSRA